MSEVEEARAVPPAQLADSAVRCSGPLSSLCWDSVFRVVHSSRTLRSILNPPLYSERPADLLPARYPQRWSQSLRRKMERLSWTMRCDHHDTMFLVQILFQMLGDWCRDVVVEILGQRAQAFFGKVFRGRRGRRRQPPRRSRLRRQNRAS